MFNTNRWETAVDRAIREAMEGGEFKDLPGEGKPLDLKDDPNTPADLQIAYKIMRDNGIAPDWVAQGRELETKQTRWRAHLAAAYATRQQGGDWAAATARLGGELEKLNSEILSYNLKLPPGITHRAQMNLEREVARLNVV
ncbi:MAG: DUF1992 domain-containing protein [Anaerolineae bacterium]